jgi:hypothetical protein
MHGSYLLARFWDVLKCFENRNVSFRPATKSFENRKASKIENRNDVSDERSRWSRWISRRSHTLGPKRKLSQKGNKTRKSIFRVRFSILSFVSSQMPLSDLRARFWDVLKCFENRNASTLRSVRRRKVSKIEKLRKSKIGTTLRTRGRDDPDG